MMELCEKTRHSAWMAAITVVALLSLLLSSAAGNVQEDPMGPVFIYEPPNSVDFSNSTGASVECSAHGNPLPTVQWIHAATSQPVANVSRLRHVLPNATLVFPPFGADFYQAEVHSSVYRCRAVNPFGTIISRSVQVRAVVLQAYDAQVYDEYVIRENTAVLKCQIPSFVADYVTVTSWVRDSVEDIESNLKKDSKFVVLPSGELYIQNVSAQDAMHTYHCRTLHWLSGEVKLSATAGKLVVTDPNGSVPPRITDGKSIVQAKERETVVLACAAQGHPAPSYSWHHKVDSGQQVAVISESRLHQVMGLLIIDQVQSEDAGTFVCSAINSLGTERIETSLNVNVPLSVHIEPVHQVLDKGREATFTCVISGYPVSSVKWSKDGRVVERDSTSRREVLRINQVRRENAGMYQCFVTNNLETVQSTAELRLGDSSPEILSGFKSYTLNPGATLSLRCTAAGIPTPKISWTVDDVPITGGERVRIGEFGDANGNVISHVNISRVQVEDGGLFACSASNKAGSTSHEAAMIVYGNPYIRSMPKITVVAGETLRMRCPVSGHPIDLIYWEMGSKLPVNHRQKAFHNGTIQVQNVQRNPDAGKYTCVALNKQGQTARREFEVTVLVPPKIIPFSFQEDQTYEGVRASVFCSLSQGDLPLTINWYKDGSAVQPNSDVTTQTIDKYASTLVIERVMAHHSGNYTCSARNSAATVNHTATIIVKVPPRWKVEPVDTSASLDSSVEIECQAEGHPAPLISWFKSLDVSSGDFVELSNSLAHQGTLRIPSAQEYDEGYYMCKATNNVGAGLSKVVFLNVQVPAKIDTKTRNETVKMDEVAKLSCVVHGDLPIQVTWSSSKHGSPITANKRFTVQEVPSDVGVTSVLSIMDAERKDSTNFKCKAKNQFGQDEASVTLIVQELPEPPHNVHLVEEGSRAVHISWSRPYDGNIPVTGYIVQYTTGDWLSSSVVFNMSVPSAQMRVTISELLPATKYRFRVLATNELGMSEPSVSVATTTGEEAPSGPPRDVRIEAMNSQTLRVTWKPPRQEYWNGEIGGYHVGYKLYNYSEPYNFRTFGIDKKTNTQNLQLTLEKLKKFTKYSIVVQAYNDHGIGPNSDEVVAMTIEDVPSSPPGNVKCSAVSSQSLHIQWDSPPAHDINGLLQGYKVLYKPIREWYTVCCLSAAHIGGGYETKITPALKTMLHGLERFTNYSINVLAFTHVGDGVKSEPIFCSTLEDAPGPPADIKALTMALDAILVSWMPPTRSNGLITKYTVYIRLTDSGREETTKVSVPGSMVRYEAKGLSKNRRYEFWVTASTGIGEGQSTRVVTQTTSGPLVSAKIASFGKRYTVSWKQTLTLPCVYIGTPAPTLRWSFLGETIQESSKIHVSQEGNLVLKDIQNIDSGNYTCTVQNSLNSDNITHQIIVEVPPDPPILSIVSTTMKSIHLSWNRPVDDNLKGVGETNYVLSFRQDYGQWSEIQVEPSVNAYTLQGLTCGTRYQVYITAHNRIGKGQASDILTAKTKGDAPKIPSKEKLILTNSTFIVLHLDSWFDGGCPILYFVVEYKRKDTTDWTLVSNNVKPDNKRFVITDLAPADAYQLKVTAHSSAGSDSAQYDFITLTEVADDRSQREVSMQEEEGVLSFLDLSIMIPAMASMFLMAAVISIVCICIKRRKMDNSNPADKVNPKYQSVNPNIGDTMKKKSCTAEAVLNIENGSLQDTKVQDSVTPYATFQILKSSQGLLPAYSSNATEMKYNTKYAPPSDNLYNENLKQAVHVCPRHQMTHSETEVPDLLEHGRDTSSSEEDSPQFHHRTLRVDGYGRHPGDPHPLAYPVTLNRNSRYSTAETTFIFPRRTDEMCLHSDDIDYSQMDRNRMNLYKHKDSSPMKIMKLY